MPPRVAPTNAVRRIGHQRAKVALRPPESFLCGAQGRIEPANQKCDRNKKGEANNCAAIFRGGVLPGQGIIAAHGEGEGGGSDSGSGSPSPRADHDGDRKEGQTALGHIGEQNRGNQSERGAEHSDAVAQNRVPGRGQQTRAKKGEVLPHTEVNLRAAKRKRRVTAVHVRVAQTGPVPSDRGRLGPISRGRGGESYNEIRKNTFPCELPQRKEQRLATDGRNRETGGGTGRA